MTDRFDITCAAARALAATGVASDRQRAEEMLSVCAAQGHEPSQRLLAQLNRKASLPAIRSEAEAGDAQAQHRYGMLLAHGRDGQPRDLAAAATWCRRAAEQGYGPAQFDLALLHLAGAGVPEDADSATHWLRQAAANEVAEAESCLELVAEGDRPRAWDAAETRVSVVLERSGPQAGKATRFAEYYVDPCLDLLVDRYRMRRDQAEDIVQQFFLELEEPLAKGVHRGQPWKEALRQGWDPQRGDFRPYLRRALVNFARDWMRQEQRRPAPAAVGSQPDLEAAADDRSSHWRPLLARFVATHAGHRPPAPRAAEVVRLVLEEGASQEALAERFGVTGRTIRNDSRLGADLLLGWLEGLLSAMPRSAHLDRLRQGMAVLPEWLHHPSQEKRTRTLILLSLVAACLETRRT